MQSCINQCVCAVRESGAWKTARESMRESAVWAAAGAGVAIALLVVLTLV